MNPVQLEIFKSLFHAIAEEVGIGPSTVWKILREGGAFSKEAP